MAGPVGVSRALKSFMGRILLLAAVVGGGDGRGGGREVAGCDTVGGSGVVGRARAWVRRLGGSDGGGVGGGVWGERSGR